MHEKSNRIVKFEQLFRSLYLPLFHYALDWVEDEEVAKDLVGELFADVWHKFDTLQHVEMRPYLYAAIRNKCKNYLVHLQVERKGALEYFRLKDDILQDPERVEQQLRTIDEVLCSQTQLTQLVFTQCKLEGKSYQSLAKELGVSVAAIHHHISKVMRALRKEFLCKKS